MALLIFRHTKRTNIQNARKWKAPTSKSTKIAKREWNENENKTKRTERKGKKINKWMYTNETINEISKHNVHESGTREHESIFNHLLTSKSLSSRSTRQCKKAVCPTLTVTLRCNSKSKYGCSLSVVVIMLLLIVVISAILLLPLLPLLLLPLLLWWWYWWCWWLLLLLLPPLPLLLLLLFDDTGVYDSLKLSVSEIGSKNYHENWVQIWDTWAGYMDAWIQHTTIIIYTITKIGWHSFSRFSVLLLFYCVVNIHIALSLASCACVCVLA